VTLMLTALAILDVAKAVGGMTPVIVLGDSLLITIAAMLLTVLMEVEDQPAAQALTNVEQEKGIVIMILTVLEI
jgi:hypothetical protein